MLIVGSPSRFFAHHCRFTQWLENYKTVFLRNIIHQSRDMTPTLKKTTWLYYRKIKIISLILNFFSYLSEFIQKYTPQRSLRSKQFKLLQQKRMKLKTFGERSFTYQAPKIWNSLPLEVKNCMTLATFKNKLKTFLFMESYFWSMF